MTIYAGDVKWTLAKYNKRGGDDGAACSVVLEVEGHHASDPHTVSIYQNGGKSRIRFDNHAHLVAFLDSVVALRRKFAASDVMDSDTHEHKFYWQLSS